MTQKIFSKDQEVQKLCEQFIADGGEVTVCPTGFVPGYNGMWRIPSYRVADDGKGGVFATYH